MSKNKKIIKRAEPIKAWAVVDRGDCQPWGNDISFKTNHRGLYVYQYPIFFQKKEAILFKEEREELKDKKLKVVPCEIILNPTQKSKGRRIR